MICHSFESQCFWHIVVTDKINLVTLRSPWPLCTLKWQITIMPYYYVCLQNCSAYFAGLIKLTLYWMSSWTCKLWISSSEICNHQLVSLTQHYRDFNYMCDKLMSMVASEGKWESQSPANTKQFWHYRSESFPYWLLDFVFYFTLELKSLSFPTIRLRVSPSLSPSLCIPGMRSSSLFPSFLGNLELAV